MKSIEWSDELSVGNDHIDAQHRDIIEMINKLVMSRDDSLDSADVADALTGLMQFMRQHFRDEEELMRKNGCPWIEEHVREHVRFAEKLTELFMMEDKELIRRTIPFLRDWLVGHLATEDMKSRPYLH
ncbi:MAG TPA: bacteriohemerythrin [Mariprofundaceae bacterium]|nr:bacteriohemerythrin [Mariprofundaceae bacterium]